MKSFRIFCLALSCCCVFKIACAAEPKPVSEEIMPLPEEEQAFFEDETRLRYSPQSKVDIQGGEVGIVTASNDAGFNLKLFDRLPLRIAINHHYISIDNSTAVKLPAHLVGLGFDFEATLPFFNYKNTYFRFGISPAVYSDSYEYESSAMRIPSRFFVIHMPDARWTWVFGVGVTPDFESPVYPILGFIYKPSDKLTLRMIPDRPSLTYSLNRKVDLFLEGGMAICSEYEVGNGVYDNTILRYSENHLGAGAAYKFNKNIRASLEAGGLFNRKLQYKDSLGKVVIKNGFYTQLGINMNF